MKTIKHFVVLSLLLMLSGCGDDLDDCLDLDGPVFQTDSLPHGVLNQEYETEIRVQIQHEPYDDIYFYDFDYDHDDLPRGLYFFQDGVGRVLEIEGTPTETGVFTLDVAVYVSGHYDLCYHRAKARYELIITAD